MYLFRFTILFYFYLSYFCYAVSPSVHDDSWRVGGKNKLYVRVDVHDGLDENLLPFYVEAHFRFIHEENVWLLILYEDSEQYHEYLLLSA